MNPIAQWLKEYSVDNGNRSFVIGVSGGVDSALTSTLCALSGVNTLVLSMPIHQETTQNDRAARHIAWLKDRFSNVRSQIIDLSQVYNSFKASMPTAFDSKLGLANSKSRLRMMTLYQVATAANGLVVGTGNKVEDFGVGFYTKYGDGGVDISPIADLLKSEVQALARELGVLEDIVDATPTDGLWNDNRTDEEQLGASYEELEWAMTHLESPGTDRLTPRQVEVLKLYQHHHAANLHKMIPIPIYKKP